MVPRMTASWRHTVKARAVARRAKKAKAKPRMAKKARVWK